MVGWKTLPATKHFFNQLHTTLEERKQNWMDGHYTGSSSDETLQLNAAAIATCQTLESIIEMISSAGDWEVDDA